MECHSWWVAAFALTYFKDRSPSNHYCERLGEALLISRGQSVRSSGSMISRPSLDRLLRIPDYAGLLAMQLYFFVLPLTS
jgi:hypothetical protein